MPHFDYILCNSFCIDINVLQMSAFRPKEWYPTLSPYSWNKWFSWFSCGIMCHTVFVCTLLTSELISYQIWKSLKKDHLTKADSQTEEGLHKCLIQGRFSLNSLALNPRELLQTNVHVCLCSSLFPLLPSLWHLGRLGETKVLKAQVHKQPGFDSFPAHKSTWFIPYERKGQTQLGA